LDGGRNRIQHRRALGIFDCFRELTQC
jgi:hypothetical protein